MKRYEIGTQAYRQYEDCLKCAKDVCNAIMEDERAYIRDTRENTIIYGNYFKLTNSQ